MLQYPIQSIPHISDSKFSYRPSTSPSGLSFSSLSASSDGDLLPDLWLDCQQEANNQYQYSNQQTQLSQIPLVSQLPQHQMLAMGVQQQQQIQSPIAHMLVWNSDYVPESRILLPNSFTNELSDLTEENLLKYDPSVASPPTEYAYNTRNTSVSAHSCEELFDFEQQQQHLHQQHQPPIISKQKPQSVNTQLYKTELCASFVKMGVCPYGNKCQFAHGRSELKIVDRPPKWRSKPCANWSKYGSCRYGNRCCFKHNE